MRFVQLIRIFNHEFRFAFSIELNGFWIESRTFCFSSVLWPLRCEFSGSEYTALSSRNSVDTLSVEAWRLRSISWKKKTIPQWWKEDHFYPCYWIREDCTLSKISKDGDRSSTLCPGRPFSRLSRMASKISCILLSSWRFSSTRLLNSSRKTFMSSSRSSTFFFMSSEDCNEWEKPFQVWAVLPTPCWKEHCSHAKTVTSNAGAQSINQSMLPAYRNVSCWKYFGLGSYQDPMSFNRIAKDSAWAGLWYCRWNIFRKRGWWSGGKNVRNPAISARNKSFQVRMLFLTHFFEFFSTNQ